MAIADPGTARFRANPAYTALPFNRLSAADRQAVSGQQVAADAYGVLLPATGSGLAPFIVGQDTALLFLTLHAPGPAPDYVAADPHGAGFRALKQLILDGVLEIEGPQGFVSGMDALAVLGLESLTSRGALAELSVAAIRYAAALPGADAPTLAQKLYTYNRRPITQRLRDLLPTRAKVAQHLGLDGANGSIPGSAWLPADSTEFWLHFSARRPARNAGGISCKLYVGIAMEELSDCFAEIADALGRGGASQFKVAAELSGLMRPDKLVAYFSSKDDLLAAVQWLTPIVAERRIHAAPFTSDIAGGGLLSWGIDPAAGIGGMKSSWRQSICERLAMALVTSRTSRKPSPEPWRFALERLRLDGIDPETFVPTATW